MDYRLTGSQKNIWNLQKYYEDTSISSICGAMLFEDSIDTETLQSALNTFLSEQDGFRLRFHMSGNEVYQYVSEYHFEQITEKNFDTIKDYLSFVEAEKKRPVFLENEKMYRFYICQIGCQSAVFMVLNHLVSDAWTLGLLGNRLAAVSYAISHNKNVSKESHSYLLHIENEEKYRASDRYAKDREYWQNIYGERPELTYIKPERQGGLSIHAKRYVQHMDGAITKKMHLFCNSNNISLAVLFEAAIYSYLRKINPESKSLTIGTPVLNRLGKVEKHIAGMFVSTVPISVSITPEMSVIDLLHHVKKQHAECFRHQRYPYSEIQEYLHENYQWTGNLYDVMVSYQNAKIDAAMPFSTEWYCNGYSEVALVVHIDDRDQSGTYRISLDYQTDVFRSEDEIALLYQRILYILNQIISEPDKSVYEIDILPEEERNMLLTKFNNTDKVFYKNQFIHVMFEHNVEKYRNRIVAKEGENSITYGDLNKYANRIALFINEKGVTSNQVVAFSLPKSIELIATILGILKSGAAYLPIDSSYPKERVDFMLSDSEAKLYLTEGDIRALDERQNMENVAVNMGKRDLCYIIYTSGSTGNPKMVGIRHYNLIHYINNLCEIYGDDCINMPLFTNPCVDLTVTSLFLPIVTGGCIHIYNNDLRNDLQDMVNNKELQIIKMTPTHMRIINKNIRARVMDNVCHVIVGGENLALTDVVQFAKKFGEHIKIHNEYGPTETTVGCGDYVFSEKDIENDFISIGHPFYNIKLYILNKYNSLMPVGYVGELCIAGDGLGAGYLNRPALTEKKFIDNPFGKGKLYRTGDLAYWREDGNIMCIGRSDLQVKIHGRRIELGEIEAVLSSIKGISQVVANVFYDKEVQYICAYYTQMYDVDISKIKKEMSKKLPYYMMPKFFQRLQEIPLTQSGKIDRKSLPLPVFDISTEKYVAPVTECEKKLCHVLEELFHIDKVGTQDDFFEMGGNSLNAIEYVVYAESVGIQMKLQMIFDHPTVGSLAKAISEKEQWQNSYYSERFAKYENLFANNYIRNRYDVKKKAIKTVLLTGVTGFLGAHILDELLTQEDCVVYCLVRSSSMDGYKGKFPQILQYYFGEKYVSEIGKRIFPVIGDITREDLSRDIPEKVDMVVHSAATVKHYGVYEHFYSVNVLGTKNVARYALNTKAKFIYISTISVSGNSFADVFETQIEKEESFFDEKSLYQGQSMENVYVRSKFEAECVVLDYMLEGLQANIIRIGNLTNRSTDFKFQPNYTENAFLSRVKAIIEFGYIPDYLLPLYCEFSPVNDVARAIVKIAQYFNLTCTVFHVNSDKVLYFDKMVELLKQLKISVKVVGGEEFGERLRVVMATEQSYIYEAFVNDMDANGKLAYDSNNRIQNEFTMSYLRQLGFEWSDIDLDYVKRYVNYFKDIGYILKDVDSEE